MRVSGEEINELISKIDHLIDLEVNEITKKKAKRIRDKYEILKSKSLNHKKFEFVYGKAERKREDEITVNDKENNTCESKNIDLASRISNYLPYTPYVTISFMFTALFLYSLTKYISSN